MPKTVAKRALYVYTLISTIRFVPRVLSRTL